MTNEEIRTRLNEWFGDERYSDEMVKAIGLIVDMDEDDRGRTAFALKAFFCTGCGTRNLPCHCQNDE